MALSKLLTLLVALFTAQTLKQVVNGNDIQSLELNTIGRAKNTYEHYRLPTSVRPEKYKLKIITHLEDPANLKFNGEVHIKLRILEDTNNITLHAQDLNIVESKIKLKRLQGIEAEANAGTQNCIKSTSTVQHHNYLIMQLCNTARKGDEYQLSIPFYASLNEHLRGYYRSSYRDRVTNETRWLAVTQFEPTAARSAFPCFDEPAYKGTFTVILGHHKNYTAISNMPLKERKPMSDKEDWIWSEFDESVPMSTYLVAYTVNDFAYVTSKTTLKNKVLFRTWARPDAIDQCNYAGVIGPKVLQFYEETFDIKFPLPKIDQIALPDFSSGAMENWGLVTYRETTLLYAENTSSFASKQSVAKVIAHELAHQWFGNLVTMKWWTDLWLNEGFATYIATLGVNHINPDWRLTELDSIENTLTIFYVDALKSSHPISQPITESSQISEIFDSISYKKGSAVLRMMHLFLGDEAFRSGVNRYLKAHAYFNAEQDDLWKALTDAAHTTRVLPKSYDIKTIMDSWTLQTGYPIITVTRDYGKKTATVTQTRYLINSNATYRTESQNCWWVPLTYTTKSELNFDKSTPRTWLECDPDRVSISKQLTDMPGDDEWVLFNLQMAGIYKVKYDERNWNMLIETMMSEDFKKIDLISRAHLVDDALTLAWSKDQNYDLALRLMKYLRREKEYIPWKSALASLSSVDRIMRETTGYEFFKKYIVKILTPIYLHLQGLNATNVAVKVRGAGDQLTTHHKVLIASWACRFEVDDCIPRALNYFIDWRNKPDPDTNNPIPTDLRGIVYCNVIRHGSENDWNFLWARYQNSNVAAEKRIILQSLGCSRESWLLQRFLDWTYRSDPLVRKQDSIHLFASVAHNEIGARLAKDFFIDNLQMLHEFYSTDFAALSHLLLSLTHRMSNRRDYEDLRDLIENNKDYFSKVEQGARRALEAAEIQCQWKEQNYKEISRLLRTSLQEI